MKIVTLKIQGMHCASCPIMIEGVLEDDVQGVKSAQASYVKQECVVEYDENSLATEDIITSIQNIGYQAEVADDK